MPPNLSIGAFVLGGVLLLLSVVSGGFKLFGAEVTGSAGRTGRVVAFMAGVVLIVTGFLHDGPEPPTRVADPTASAPISQAPAVLPTAERQTPVVARLQTAPAAPAQTSRNTDATVRQSSNDPVLRVEWRAATQELMAIATSLSDARKMELGLNVMLTGWDIYAIHIRVTNVGGAAIDVSPEHLRFKYNGESLPLTRDDDRRFFQAVRLEPNRYAEGILMFKAPVLVAGAVMAGARLSYEGAGVQVIYPE